MVERRLALVQPNGKSTGNQCWEGDILALERVGIDSDQIGVERE
jgi:hypothetical protein